jgi:hypothetical protein
MRSYRVLWDLSIFLILKQGIIALQILLNLQYCYRFSSLIQNDMRPGSIAMLRMVDYYCYLSMYAYKAVSSKLLDQLFLPVILMLEG